MSNPTLLDAGISKHDLKIEIVINPIAKTVSITENVHDPLLFAYLMGQALQTYSQRQMVNKASTIGIRTNGGSS